MRTYLNHYFTLFCLLPLLAGAQYKHIAFINGIAHIGNGQVIENALVAINQQSIELVTDSRGIKLSYKSYDTVIDLAGKHIYPALINPNNVLGLHDAEAVRATVDFAEVGALNSHVRALIAYNTDNVIIPTVKTNGVLYTQATPRGNLISGSSSIMALEGWNWEDAVVKADDGIHVNFPRSPIRRSDDEKRTKEQHKHYQDELSRLENFYADARAYQLAGKTATEKNIRFEAMKSVLAGTANLYFHADRVKDILAVIAFCEKYKVPHAVLVGGKEAYKVTAELKRAKMPVMLNRVFDLPDRGDEDVDLAYRLPALLQKDSILFCLQIEGDMEAMHSRNLPFNAGAAVAYGLTSEQALSAVTLNAAKILGIDKQLGTLEEGKLASLVISTGDLLDMRSNNVVQAYIAGKSVDLTNRQIELYTKYKTKYGIK